VGAPHTSADRQMEEILTGADPLRSFFLEVGGLYAQRVHPQRHLLVRGALPMGLVIFNERSRPGTLTTLVEHASLSEERLESFEVELEAAEASCMMVGSSTHGHARTT
jgi:hypothetical protein